MQRLLAFFFAAALLWTPAWSQSAPDALVPDLSQYILTPPAPPTPRINGAKVFGARPGSEFLFAIPASGDRPMTFAAEGLPKGFGLFTTGIWWDKQPSDSYRRFYPIPARAISANPLLKRSEGYIY